MRTRIQFDKTPFTVVLAAPPGTMKLTSPTPATPVLPTESCALPSVTTSASHLVPVHVSHRSCSAAEGCTRTPLERSMRSVTTAPGLEKASALAM